MTKKITLLIASLLLVSCASSEQEADTAELDARIARIENGLRPNLQIKGRELEIFNINERMHELNIPGVSVANNQNNFFAENAGVERATNAVFRASM